MVFLLLWAKGLFKLCFLIKKMLNCCTLFSVQNISNNGFRVHSTKQCFSAVIGKKIVKTMHFYKKCLSIALALVFKICLTMAFKKSLHNNIFLVFSAKGFHDFLGCSDLGFC